MPSAMPADLYVQIPAYRDRELLPTLQDLVRTATEPGRLRVAVAWQFGEEEAHLEDALRACPQVELTAIPAARSQGCNWARALLQQGWRGERYTLFLDSHHRFVPGWDATLVELLESQRAQGHAKPVITAYLPAYDPAREPLGREPHLYAIHAREREQGLLFRLRGEPVGSGVPPVRPFPAHFVSLHCLFADGSFNREVAFDPAIYFFADEVAVALRAHTWGYALFHPHRVLGWHAYDRATRVTHWADHGGWQRHNEASCARLRALYAGELRGVHGVGPVRSVADYEHHIGRPLISRDTGGDRHLRHALQRALSAAAPPRRATSSFPTSGEAHEAVE